MALTLIDKPYQLAPRGQRLLFKASSDNISQDGFRYGVQVMNENTSKTYEFFVDRSPASDALLFDLAPVVKLYNDESTQKLHNRGADDIWEETAPNGWAFYTIILTEWWLIGGVLTLNEGSQLPIEQRIFNGYYQPNDGYKPDVMTGARDVRFSLYNNQSYAMSERKWNTHTWFNGGKFNQLTALTKTFIPCLSTDAGLLFYPASNTYLTNNIFTHIKIIFFTGVPATAPITYSINPLDTIIEGFPCYPLNLELATDPDCPKPSDYPNWTHYYVTFNGVSESLDSIIYCFYNAELYGQSDCRYDNIRLAWVNSRGGWDYQNFIKKNEITLDIQRKQYKQLLMNSMGTFNSNQRQLTDRETIVTKNMTAMSDWIQEEEFVFLHSLYASNQVHLVNADGSHIPVNIVDNSYTQKKERNGKLYNITIKFTYSQDYWT